LHIAPATEADLDALSALLIETIAGNGSVGFMHPLAEEDARAFWSQALASASHGERVVLGAWRDDRLVGTGTLVLAMAPSQPHRAELTKVMTAHAARGEGVGAALIDALEQSARSHGKSLLTLDAAVIEGATTFYRRLGFHSAGDIPNYAYKPLGGLGATRVFWKSLDEPAADALSPRDAQADERWMRRALALAERAASENGEIPVGAIIVSLDGDVVGEGWNLNIGEHDPSAHAEIVAMRRAGQTLGNHRLVGCTLYVTLEPCVMCAGALVHARIARVVYAASDPKTGAAGSVFDTLVSDRHNHRITVEGGLLASEAGTMLREFFRSRR